MHRSDSILTLATSDVKKYAMPYIFCRNFSDMIDFKNSFSFKLTLPNICGKAIIK